MVKFLLVLLFLFFMMNNLSKLILQIIYQSLLFFMMFIFLLSFPLNNLNSWVKIYYILGVDYYSYMLVILSFWVLLMMIMISSENFLNLNYLIYFYILNLLLMFLFICFTMMNLMMFYMFFEASLLPIFLLIMGWGYQIDRLQAGFYMMLYTLFGSLPLLVMILLIYNKENSLMMDFIEFKFNNLIIYIMLLIAFFIKMPMYFFHLWLPKAHVEAPLVGSMVLAGVMLKLGSYGILRFMMIMIYLCLKFNKFFIIISLMGGVYASLICLFQIDMKMLVAYSSIVHMSILMSGLLTMYNWGIDGSLMMMVAHGLCSSGLFCLVNISYIRFKSRSLLINKGLINFFPSLSMMWFLLCSSNLSFPPSLNLFGEMFLLNSLVMWSLKLMLILMILMFLSASYSLYLYSWSQHGMIFKSFLEIKGVMILEFLVLILHWIPLNLMFCVFFLYS